MRKYDKEVLQAQLDNEKAVLKQLEQNYKDSLEEVNSKIAELMGRADADMQHVIYQVDYQRALKAQIQGILKTLQSNEFSTVSEYLTKCYDEGFLGTMYAMQSQGIPLVIPMNQEEIAAAIQHETNLSSGLYKAFDTADLQKKIAGEISRGFTVGSSFAEIARNVSAYANISKNNAGRIVRTEGHRIVETAAHHAQQKAKDRGADVVKIWDAALDAKTRDSHVKVDGEIRDVDKKFSNGLMFPGDPSGKAAEVINCRCRARTEARWALDANQTKMLGDTSKMTPTQRENIAKKLGISEDALDQYSGQIVPIKAKNYKDFKNQYNKLWQYEGSDLQKKAESRIAGYEKAKSKAAEKESQYGVRYGAVAVDVDLDYVDSNEYKKKFSKLTGNEKVNNSVHKTCEDILKHCDGTEHEDMYLINANDGSIFAKITDTAKNSGVVYTDEFEAKLRESKEKGIPIIGIHNHPQGTPPSPDDFRKAYDNGYAFGIIPGHNGQLYKYETPSKPVSKELSAMIDRELGIALDGGVDVDRAFQTLYNAYGLVYTIIEGK